MDKLLVISLGSNLGNRSGNLSFAVRRISEETGTLMAVSSVRETEGFGVKDHPAYLNQVISLKTSLTAHQILEITEKIESEAGRTDKKMMKPRALDIDIISLGDLILDEPALKIPHPSAHLRAFVLEPLSEILPGWKHPVFKKTAVELLSGLAPF